MNNLNVNRCFLNQRDVLEFSNGFKFSQSKEERKQKFSVLKGPPKKNPLFDQDALVCLGDY